MPKIKLEKQHLWKGKFYGPGEAEFPEDAIAAFQLAKEQEQKSKPESERETFSEESSSEKLSPEAEGSASPTTKPPKAKA